MVLSKLSVQRKADKGNMNHEKYGYIKSTIKFQGHNKTRCKKKLSIVYPGA